MSIIGSMTSNALPAGYKLSGGTSSKSDIYAKMAEALKELASKTPMERARDQVLEKHGISKDQYDQMSGPKRDAIDKEIAEAAKRAALAMNQDKKPKNAGIRFA